MANVWGYWGCKYCGTKIIRGDKTSCPHCGAGRDKNVKFYMREGVLEYVAPKQENKKENWICSYCGLQNDDSKNVCIYCNATREADSKKYSEIHTPKKIENTNKNHENYERKESTENHETKTDDEVYSEIEEFFGISLDKYRKKSPDLDVISKKYEINKLSAVSVVVIIIFAVLIGGLFLGDGTVHAEVQNFSWSRKINIEKFGTFEEESWNFPKKARLISSEEQIKEYKDVVDHYETKTREVPREVLDHYEERTVEVPVEVIDHYETVVDGYKDLGNGQFEEITRQEPVYRTEYETKIEKEPVYITVYDTEKYTEPVYTSEPVYATKYYYEIDKWVFDYCAKSSGNDKEPYWKEVVLEENQRNGSKSEVYTIYCKTDDGKSYNLDISYDLWTSLNSGDEISFEKDFSGDIKYDTICKTD